MLGQCVGSGGGGWHVEGGATTAAVTKLATLLRRYKRGFLCNVLMGFSKSINLSVLHIETGVEDNNVIGEFSFDFVHRRNEQVRSCTGN